MKTIICYFSGTGNSLHISRELRKRVKDADLLPMIGTANKGNMAVDADAVGFVFPIHCLGLPIIVREFLQKIRVRSASYLFAITSRECSSRVSAEIDRILFKQGKRLDSFFSVQMPQTYLPLFEVDDADEAARKEAVMLMELDSIASAIIAKEHYRKPDPKEFGMYIYYAIRPVIMFINGRSRYFNLENKFYADEKCDGCGLCGRICLSGKIEMRDRRPVWNQRTNCLFCFACIHYCPARAIQFRNSKTTVRGRYHHPLVPAAEIAAQKSMESVVEPGNRDSGAS